MTHADLISRLETEGPSRELLADALVALTPHERRALACLVDHYCPDFGFVSFGTVSMDTGLDRRQTKRAVRMLARKGLAQYAKGLLGDDGQLRGAGYAATDRIAAIFRAKETK